MASLPLFSFNVLDSKKEYLYFPSCPESEKISTRQISSSLESEVNSVLPLLCMLQQGRRFCSCPGSTSNGLKRLVVNPKAASSPTSSLIFVLQCCCCLSKWFLPLTRPTHCPLTMPWRLTRRSKVPSLFYVSSLVVSGQFPRQISRQYSVHEFIET